MILFIGLCAFLTITLLAIALGRELSSEAADLDSRIEAIARSGTGAAGDVRGRRLLRKQNYSTVPWMQRLLEGTPRAERMAESLERAGIRMHVGPFLTLSAGLGLLFALLVLVWLPAGLLRVALMAGAFLLGLYLPSWFVKRRIRRRRAQFEAVLPDALDMIGRSLRAGGGLLIAIDNMTEQISGPVSAEFGRLHQEIAAGLPVEDAFHELDRRVASKDLHIAVTAILVQREVGGNLAEILNNISAMMRERVRLRGEVKAITSRQIFSTYGMAAMPPFMIIAVFILARPLVQPLLTHQAGWFVLGIAGFLELCGVLIVRRIAASPVGV